MTSKKLFQIFVVVIFHFPKLFTNSISCFCTTDDCIRQKRTACDAPTTCFREYLQESTDTPIKFHTRGCISEANPLMCDQNLSFPTGNGPKLYLECCYTKFCNIKTKPNMRKLSIFLELIQQRTNEALLLKSNNAKIISSQNPDHDSEKYIQARFQYPLSLIIILAAISGIALIIILIFTMIKLVLLYANTNNFDNDQIYSVSLSGSSNDPDNSHISTINSKKLILYSSNPNIRTFYRKIVNFFKPNHHQQRDILT